MFFSNFLFFCRVSYNDRKYDSDKGFWDMRQAQPENRGKSDRCLSLEQIMEAENGEIVSCLLKKYRSLELLKGIIAGRENGEIPAVQCAAQFRVGQCLNERRQL